MLLFLLLVSARAEEPPAPAPGEEIVVEAEASVAARRQELEDALLRLGMVRGLHIGDRTVYRPLRPWKPRVKVYDWGGVDIHARLVQPMGIVPVQQPDGTVQWSLAGTIAGRRTVRNMESRTFSSIEPQLQAWYEALGAEGQARRLVDVRARVTAIWLDGVAPDGTPLPNAADRRSALVALWLNTADSEPGEKSRDVVEAYIDAVVQCSESPFTDAEIDAANAARAFPREMVASGCR